MVVSSKCAEPRPKKTDKLKQHLLHNCHGMDQSIVGSVTDEWCGMLGKSQVDLIYLVNVIA